MLEQVFGVTAATAGVALGLAPVLQIRRMLSTRSSREVSIGFLIILLIDFSVWTMYGFVTNDMVIVIPNMVAIGTAAATILVATRLRRTHFAASATQ